jgi:hypothetical protein
MTARYWFRPKRYGYGATPVTWEGWLVVAVSVALIMAAGYFLVGAGPQSVFAALVGLALMVAIVIATILVTKARTEGGWKWRWGDRE